MSSLLLVKSGNDLPPLFIVPGGAQNAQSVIPYGSRIRTLHPVYAVQIWNGDEDPGTAKSVEQIAHLCVDKIRDVQRRGPYLLAGYSFGGLIALEAANQLLERGEQVAFCGLLDSYPHQRYWPRKELANFIVGRIGFHFHELAKVSAGKKIPYIARRARLFIEQYLRWSVEDTIDTTIWDSSEQRLYGVPLIRYLPRFYNGTISYLKAENRTHFPADPTSIWEKLATRLVIYTVPGDHQSMINEHFDSVAIQLSACVQKLDQLCGLYNSGAASFREEGR